MKTLRGIELMEKDKKHVLNAYVYRYTKDHKPAWANGSSYFKVQFESDLEWLEHTYFYVKANGRLDMRHKHCESHPIWPNNPELRF